MNIRAFNEGFIEKCSEYGATKEEIESLYKEALKANYPKHILKKKRKRGVSATSFIRGGLR